MTRREPTQIPYPPRWSRLAFYMLHSLAAAMLVVIVWLNSLFWRVPYLGYQAHEESGIIGAVVPESAAAQAGLHVGDRMVRLYQLPWNAVFVQPNLVPLIGRRDQPIPITVERQGMIISLLLVQPPPDLAFQTEKVVNLALALVCWMAGYVLGIVRRPASDSARIAAWFWLLVSGISGSYVFASYASYPLKGALQWLMITVIVPLAIYTHLWFPPRAISIRGAQLARRLLLITCVAFNAGLLMIVAAWHPSWLQLFLALDDWVVGALFIGFAGSAALLLHAYQQTRVAHLRRQIRLIALACGSVGSIWACALIIPFVVGYTVVTGEQYMNGVVGVIPLAYLIGGLVPDLYRVDRVLTRVSTHLLSIILLGIGALLLVAQLDLQSTSALLWLALCLAVAYRPMQRLWLRVLSMRHRTSSYGTLHAALTELTTTLDTATLLATLHARIRQTFDLPAFALYDAPSDHAHALVLVAQERLADAPARIGNGAVLQLLSQQRGVRANAWMEQQLRYQPLHEDEAQVLRHPQVALWCPIVHHDGQLLALLLLGMRGDVDPYRAQDRRELQRLLDAAALALTNSAAYRRQIEAEAVIRHLYQQVQVAQHTTATAIARELHDEVININVRLNIESVYKVLSLVETPAARAELELMLQSEYTVVDTLRRICEDLNPTGSDDPLGLASVVRAQIARVCAPWAGT